MSKPRLVRTELLDATESELDAAGFTYREEHGGKHPKVIVDVGDREEPIVLSSTSSDWRAVKNQRAFIRRKIREWKAEAAAFGNEFAAPALSQPMKRETVMDSTAVAESANITLFYEGHPIADRGEMLSLTDMWRAAGSDDAKRPSKWLERDAAKDFLDALSASLNVYQADIIKGSRGKGGSTFAHWQAGMAYAKYLSPEFHMWCNEVVRSHMSKDRAPTIRGDDDLSALLEMLSDMQSAIMGAVQRSDSYAIDRVKDVKDALLHYMKVQLKEPSYAFFDDVRTRNKAAWERDKLLVKEVRELKTAVAGLMKKAETPLLSRPFVFADWYDHDKIYQEFFKDQFIPNRRFLSQAITKSLDSYCKKRQRGFDMQSRRIGGRNVNLWHRDSVKPWVAQSGLDIVRNHLAKSRRADPVVLAFGGRR